MINSFLVHLQNSETPPVNPLSTTGDILWPDNVRVRTYTGTEAIANDILFAGEVDSLARFLLAIQLLWVVEDSVRANTILAHDPRITYTRRQLAGQFAEQAGFEQHVSHQLQNLDRLQALSFLQGDNLRVYRTALSDHDRLACVVAHFGAPHV